MEIVWEKRARNGIGEDIVVLCLRPSNHVGADGSVTRVMSEFYRDSHGIDLIKNGDNFEYSDPLRGQFWLTE